MANTELPADAPLPMTMLCPTLSGNRVSRAPGAAVNDRAPPSKDKVDAVIVTSPANSARPRMFRPSASLSVRFASVIFTGASPSTRRDCAWMSPLISTVAPAAVLISTGFENERAFTDPSIFTAPVWLSPPMMTTSYPAFSRIRSSALKRQPVPVSASEPPIVSA